MFTPWSGTPERSTSSSTAEEYFTFRNEGTRRDAWPFDKAQYLILNLAIGGAWGGEKGIDDGIFPQQYQIDYVRVYQKPCATREPDGVGLRTNPTRQRGPSLFRCSAWEHSPFTALRLHRVKEASVEP